MGIFRRLFSIGKAEAHSAIDKMEDPVKLTQQGIRELKEDLDESIKALAEVKAMAIRSRNEANNHREQMKSYESKAMKLVQRAEAGELDQAEADRLATMALEQKERSAQNLQTALQHQKTYDAQVAKLDANIRKLKSNISKWENEAKTLQARAKVSEATRNVNKQLAEIDSSSTVSMLERMKTKVEEKEALAESYADIAYENRSIDEEIDEVLKDTSQTGSAALDALKAKMKGDDSAGQDEKTE
jgi:phage shock protein A